MDAKSVEEFQEQIGIKFHEPSRLWNAFIHSSYANERRMSKDKNNERLEFLGDAVLELVTSNYLYRTYPVSYTHLDVYKRQQECLEKKFKS